MELLANLSMILSLGPLIFDGKPCPEVINVAELGGTQGLAAGTRLARGSSLVLGSIRTAFQRATTLLSS